MTKNDVKDWKDLVLFSGIRAKGSAKRNDPWAWSYWRRTALWAEEMGEDDFMKDPSNWLQAIGMLMSQVKHRAPMDHCGAALLYSRAKWLAIMLRNRGQVVPREKAPALAWLHGIEGPRPGPVPAQPSLPFVR